MGWLVPPVPPAPTSMNEGVSKEVLQIRFNAFSICKPALVRGRSRKKSDCCSPQYKWALSLSVGMVEIAKLC